MANRIGKLKLISLCAFLLILSYSLLPDNAQAMSGEKHAGDMIEVLLGNRSAHAPELRKLLKKLSSIIDNFEVIKGLPVGKAGHRVYGHWGFSGDIPFNKPSLKDVLDKIEATEGKAAREAAKQKIIKAWHDDVKKIIKLVEQNTGLIGKQARGLAGLFYDIHLLGDWSGVQTSSLQAADELGKDVIKSLERMLGKKSPVVKKVAEEIKTAIKACKGVSKCHAEAILKILKNSKELQQSLLKLLLRKYPQLSKLIAKLDDAKLNKIINKAPFIITSFRYIKRILGRTLGGLAVIITAWETKEVVEDVVEGDITVRQGSSELGKIFTIGLGIAIGIFIGGLLFNIPGSIIGGVGGAIFGILFGGTIGEFVYVLIITIFLGAILYLAFHWVLENVFQTLYSGTVSFICSMILSIVIALNIWHGLSTTFPIIIGFIVGGLIGALFAYIINETLMFDSEITGYAISILCCAIVGGYVANSVNGDSIRNGNYNITSNIIMEDETENKQGVIISDDDDEDEELPASLLHNEEDRELTYNGHEETKQYPEHKYKSKYLSDSDHIIMAIVALLDIMIVITLTYSTCIRKRIKDMKRSIEYWNKSLEKYSTEIDDMNWA